MDNNNANTACLLEQNILHKRSNEINHILRLAFFLLHFGNYDCVWKITVCWKWFKLFFNWSTLCHIFNKFFVHSIQKVSKWPANISSNCWLRFKDIDRSGKMSRELLYWKIIVRLCCVRHAFTIFCVCMCVFVSFIFSIAWIRGNFQRSHELTSKYNYLDKLTESTTMKKVWIIVII